MINKTILYSHYLILLILLVLFLITRLYQIDKIPASVYWDEASIGVNAYSILKTGKDEWGEFLPIHFKAFGEYKLPVYIYSVAITQSILGLNELAVRLPAVVYSFGSILVLYFLVRRLLEDKNIALLAVFLMTITPWFFIFSRTGYEVTAGLFFFLLGVLSFFLADKSKWFLVSTMGCFILAFYSYNSFRIITPLFSLYLLLVLFYQGKIKELVNSGSTKLLVILVTIVLGLLPIVSLLQSADGLKRFNDIGIFSVGVGIVEGLKIFTKNYLSHFSFDFLFLTGDQNIRSHTMNVGELFWIQLPLIIVGIIRLLKKKSLKLTTILILLAIGPIPAAITRESPHALRSIIMVIPLSILTAVGIGWGDSKLKLRLWGVGFIVVLLCLFFSIYFEKYINNYNLKSADSWQYGYRQVFSNYKHIFSDYDQVIISDRYNQPYIFYLFYGEVDPNFFQQHKIINHSPRIETSVVKQIDKIHFTEIHFADLPSGKTLFFAHPSEKLTEIMAKDTIWNPDKTVAFYVYEYKK